MNNIQTEATVVSYTDHLVAGITSAVFTLAVICIWLVIDYYKNRR